MSRPITKHPEEKLREALSRLIAAAWHQRDPRTSVACFSIPANPDRDAYLILGTALDELMALRAASEPRAPAAEEAPRRSREQQVNCCCASWPACGCDLVAEAEAEAAPRPLTEAEQNECWEYADKQFPAFQRGWRRDWNVAYDEKAAEIRARRTPPSAPPAEPSMCLPDGKTCGDCARFDRCVALFQCPADSTECDWYPVRFKSARDPSASGEPTR